MTFLLNALQLDLTRNSVFILDTKLEAEYFFASPNDILVSQTGTRYKRDYGFLVSVPESVNNLLINQRILCLTVVNMVLPKFVAYYGNTSSFRDFFFSQETGGVNQGNVGVSGVMDAPFPLPSFSEQQEIVRIIESAFSLFDFLAVESQHATALLDRLDQATLAKAFRGELVTHETAEPPPAPPAMPEIYQTSFAL